MYASERTQYKCGEYGNRKGGKSHAGPFADGPRQWIRDSAEFLLALGFDVAQSFHQGHLAGGLVGVVSCFHHFRCVVEGSQNLDPGIFVDFYRIAFGWVLLPTEPLAVQRPLPSFQPTGLIHL